MSERLSSTGSEIDGDLVDLAEVPSGDGLGADSEDSPVAVVASPDDAAGRVRCRRVEGGWVKLRVSESRGIAVVSFADIALINELEIREVDRELRGLIEGGRNCILLSFDRVVRMSSQVIALVLNTHRRCSAEGGRVKICQIHPDLREIFAITGVFLTVDIYPDLRAALASDWPEPSPRRPAPEAPQEPSQPGEGQFPPLRDDEEDPFPLATDAAAETLIPAIPLEDDPFVAPPKRTAPASPQSPARRPATVPVNGRNGTHAGKAEAVVARPVPSPSARAAEAPARLDRPRRRVRLTALVGRAQGRAIAIPPPRFIIGRDLSCQLRAHSPIVSRFHALIEQRDGRVFLRDLGSANGTILEGRTLQSHEEVEVADGQRLQVGPMLFSFAIDPVAIPAAPPASLSRHPHVHPLIQCPHCGTDGWLSIDQLLLAIARAMTQTTMVAPPRPHIPLEPEAPARGPSPEVRPKMPAVVIPFPPRQGHPDATSPHVAANGNGRHDVSPVATSHPGAAGGCGLGPSVGRSGNADPHVRRPSDGGEPSSPSMPSRRAAPSPLEGPASAAAEEEEPEFPDVLDLLPLELAIAPTQELKTRNLPAPLAPRALDIDYHCPECGSEVLVPVDRLDQQLQCPKCDASLYTDEGGGLCVGDINDRPRGPNAFEDKETDFLGRVIDGWKALPRSAQGVLSGAAAVLLCASILWVATIPRLPATLKDRAIFVAEAFAREDYRSLRAITAPGGSKGVSRWMEQVRPLFWRGKTQKVWVKVSIEQQDKRKGEASLLAHVSAITGTTGSRAIKRPSSLALQIPSGRPAAGPVSVKGVDNKKIDLRLFWVLGRDGQWLLDGTRTGAAGPSKAAESTDELPQTKGAGRLPPRDIQ